MRVRITSFEKRGLFLTTRVLPRRRMTLAYGEILSAERRGTRRGFRLHTTTAADFVVVASTAERRAVEAELRRRCVRIVDEWGAQIDESQFEKEADPKFNRRVKSDLPGFWRSLLEPNFVRRWRYDRSMRQSSDDAGSC